MDTTLLETERLILAKPRLGDAEEIYRNYARDPDVTRYVMWKPHVSVEETIIFINLCINNWEKGNHLTWCIREKEKGGLIGMIHLIMDAARADFGYVLMKSRWGRGLMTEALKRVVEFAFTHDTIYRVWGVCDVDNAASARVMEKAGLAREGVLRKFSVHPNISDVPRDVYVYSIIR
jgi:[ribosomal protein S5]-alanine N-acetyltransferase